MTAVDTSFACGHETLPRTPKLTSTVLISNDETTTECTERYAFTA